MNYPPAVLLSCVIHHLRTPMKPTQEKGHLVGPVGLSILQDIRHEENPAKARDRPFPLSNTRPTRPGASPDRYRPCIRLSEPSLHLKWSSLPSFEDRRYAFHSPWTAYPGLRSSPWLLHPTLCYVRWLLRSL